MTTKLPKPAVRWTLTPKGVYIQRPEGNCYVNAARTEDNRLIAKAPAMRALLEKIGPYYITKDDHAEIRALLADLDNR